MLLSHLPSSEPSVILTSWEASEDESETPPRCEVVLYLLKLLTLLYSVSGNKNKEGSRKEKRGTKERGRNGTGMFVHEPD